MQEEAANLCNRSTTANDGDSGREQVCVCVLAHTYCGTFMLLENGGDIIGVFLFLLCVVLHQWRSFGSPAPGFLCQQARWA